MADRWVENRPSRGGRALRPRELWEHRSLIAFLTGRNLKVRYKQAALGVGWAFIQPIVAGLTLTLVFGRLTHVGSDGAPYLPFVMLGYSGWSLFSNGVTGATTSLVVDRPLITKVYFPRVLVPLSMVLPGFVDFALAMIPLAVVMAVTGVSPGLGLITLPLWVLAIGVVSLGVGLVFATLNVRYRDAAALLGISIQLLVLRESGDLPSIERSRGLSMGLCLEPHGGSSYRASMEPPANAPSRIATCRLAHGGRTHFRGQPCLFQLGGTEFCRCHLRSVDQVGSALAIDMKGIGKRYALGQDRRLNRSLPESVLRRLTKPSGRRDEIWSLRDIDLEVAEGEALGIVGSNGAGKSTLLKILARITEPTVGVSRTRGRIGSLLEVGTGFHPELTGRENVYLSGAISGMRRSRITSLYDEIVAFAGVERFLDTPVKRYSSGMYLRLAFAVAAHLDARHTSRRRSARSRGRQLSAEMPGEDGRS